MGKGRTQRAAKHRAQSDEGLLRFRDGGKLPEYLVRARELNDNLHGPRHGREDDLAGERAHLPVHGEDGAQTRRVEDAGVREVE